MELQDNPRAKNLLWHSFLWSYDRQPYMADFMEFNKLRSLICSHSATPYHFITTFIPQQPQLYQSVSTDKYNIQSVTRGEDTY